MRNTVLSTQAEVARALCVSPGTVRDWMAAGMPGRDGAYDLALIVPWLRANGPWKPACVDSAVFVIAFPTPPTPPRSAA